MAAPLGIWVTGARWFTEISQAPSTHEDDVVSDSNVTRDYRWDCHGSPGPTRRFGRSDHDARWRIALHAPAPGTKQ